MDDEQFWTLVEAARRRAASADSEAVAEAFVDVLEELPAPDAAASDVACVRIVNSAYRWSLWGAAYLANGGCSDDSFFYFRGWLLTRGRTVWDAVLADPDSLAEHLTADDLDEVKSESMLNAPWEAYARLTLSENLPEELEYPDEPELGHGWDFDDAEEMQARYPRLWALVGAR